MQLVRTKIEREVARFVSCAAVCCTALLGRVPLAPLIQQSRLSCNPVTAFIIPALIENQRGRYWERRNLPSSECQCRGLRAPGLSLPNTGRLRFTSCPVCLCNVEHDRCECVREYRWECMECVAGLVMQCAHICFMHWPNLRGRRMGDGARRYDRTVWVE